MIYFVYDGAIKCALKSSEKQIPAIGESVFFHADNTIWLVVDVIHSSSAAYVYIKPTERTIDELPDTSSYQKILEK